MTTSGASALGAAGAGDGPSGEMGIIEISECEI
jgi:hypothetical protein